MFFRSYDAMYLCFLEGRITSLVELSAQAVACHIPFEVVEHFPQPIPDEVQLRIAFWSFPENEEEIRYNEHSYKSCTLCNTCCCICLVLLKMKRTLF